MGLYSFWSNKIKSKKKIWMYKGEGVGVTNACQNKRVEKRYEELGKFIDDLPQKKGILILVLHKAQELFGYLPKEVQKFVAEKLKMPMSEVYGVVSFYSYFTTKPRGKYVVNICMGTACFVRGAAQILEGFEKRLNIKAGETTMDGKYTLEILRCIGACGLAPVVTVNDKVYGHFTTDQVVEILKEYAE